MNDLESFPWAKEFVDSEKSLFVRIAYEDDEEIRMPSSLVDNDMEAGFVTFLTRAEDIISFVKKHSTYCGIKNHNIDGYIYTSEKEIGAKKSLLKIVMEVIRVTSPNNGHT